ncbi:LA_3751/LA_3752 family putative glycosyltransferase [Leptothoe kymatousa]|uniref:Dolichol-phosphate mannosyltransferase n=1 Tax=Leptothoe kymatousa TAU-MAC 1615 TaxID=2364775 RepID=A0ABS5Y4B3_9CYAN|nr:hypothetical protein [Leptothoe kymatousa]MBT9312679.1 hypothetical protein [Leptothoe kymatousa TAU-MAC 1615]
MRSFKGWRSWLLPSFVMLLGIGISLGLLTYGEGGVFFNGDAGLRALLSQQLTWGSWQQVSLNISQPPWVLALWRQGLYPFTPPYAYEQQGNYFIDAPFTFSVITAPFYRLLGYRGFYVIPIMSLWVIWGRIWQVCRIWQVRSTIIALSLSLVIFASPLTLYGAMYWEHTLAVALAFWGISGMLFHSLPEGFTSRISFNQALVNGVCIGLATWLRSEFFCLVLVLAVFMALSLLPHTYLPKWLQLEIPQGLSRLLVSTCLGAMGATVLGLLAINAVIYGHPLGVNALEVDTAISVSQRLAEVQSNYIHLVVALLRYFPAVLLGLGLPWLMQGQARETALRLVWVGGLFAVIVPLAAPLAIDTEQWGPRFYLILIPLVGLVVAAALRHLWLDKNTRNKLFAAIACIIVIGSHSNLVNGGLRDYRDPLTNSTSLPRQAAPVVPAIKALSNYDERWVAMSHQHVAQQLWPSVRSKIFFRVKTDPEIEQLAAALVDQNETSFIYICDPIQPCSISEQQRFLYKLPNNQIDLAFESLGTFGHYPFYRGVIQTEATARPAFSTPNSLNGR